MKEKAGIQALVIERLGKKPKMEEDSGYGEGLEASMEELLSAIEDKDPKRMAECFKNALDLCEMSPHEESDLE